MTYQEYEKKLEEIRIIAEKNNLVSAIVFFRNTEKKMID